MNVVRSFRLKLCWEQSKLAKELDVSIITVSAWETGRRNPSLPHRLKMSEIAKEHKIKFNTDDFIRE